MCLIASSSLVVCRQQRRLRHSHLFDAFNVFPYVAIVCYTAGASDAEMVHIQTKKALVIPPSCEQHNAQREKAYTGTYGSQLTTAFAPHLPMTTHRWCTANARPASATTGCSKLCRRSRSRCVYVWVCVGVGVFVCACVFVCLPKECECVCVCV